MPNIDQIETAAAPVVQAVASEIQNTVAPAVASAADQAEKAVVTEVIPAVEKAVVNEAAPAVEAVIAKDVEPAVKAAETAVVNAIETNTLVEDLKAGIKRVEAFVESDVEKTEEDLKAFMAHLEAATAKVKAALHL
jgi:hypothetical protein